MKRSIIALMTTAFIAFGAQFAYAQPGRGMGMDPEQQIKEMISQLDITKEQEPAFREAMGKVNAMRMEGMGGMREGRGPGQGQGPGPDASHDGHNAPGDQASSAPRGQGQGQDMEMMAKRRAEMEEKTLAILAPVLSGAQITKYKELEAARMEQMMSRMRR